ncbi:MetQ/NlpA family ABC transporter substrate-binding protein [Phytoactinopolyspora halotolerans]|uniref:Methionine ABC transporter substrate-binding protein n=1 Tax=Phytoactinopolyspora halotolerans TaxID=1981512 RepID=A0A6L9S403_9ACTN|nr:MetQ/NlpA family ABC transporter substrate-binding protein [Phytoactinopolyspora halotolerans]NED99758.1 methionine ABC transporter substrate-binding protein [Phytoactinopolyspora halotolerans]
MFRFTSTARRTSGGDRPRGRHSAAARIGGLLAGLAALSLLTACGGDGDTAVASGESGDPIKIGVVGASEDYWKIFTDLAAEEGIDVELVNFTDYTQPNPALSQGQLDLNQFQHLQYLAAYNVANDDDLTPIGATAIYPLALYSKEHASLEDIPEGAEIAIPNDETNQARALLVLQDAGLLTLENGGDSTSLPSDIVAEESKVTVTPVAAEQTAVALNSVDASIINNDFVADAGLEPEDALYQDQADSPAARPYINVWVARSGEEDNETFQRLVELYHTAEVEEASSQASGGTAVFTDNPADELQGILDEIEGNLAAQG